MRGKNLPRPTPPTAPPESGRWYDRAPSPGPVHRSPRWPTRWHNDAEWRWSCDANGATSWWAQTSVHHGTCYRTHLNYKGKKHSSMHVLLGKKSNRGPINCNPRTYPGPNGEYRHHGHAEYAPRHGQFPTTRRTFDGQPSRSRST